MYVRKLRSKEEAQLQEKGVDFNRPPAPKVTTDAGKPSAGVPEVVVPKEAPSADDDSTAVTYGTQ